MNSCISCGSETKTEKQGTENRLIFSCEKCGSYDISQSAQIRLNRNKAERKRFCSALKKAHAANKPLVVTVESGSGIKFRVESVSA